MMELKVSMLTAAILAIGLVALSVPISLRRRSSGISLGLGEDAHLTRLVRAHGNFIEYAPMGLIVLGLMEMVRGAGGMVCAVAALLVAGRVLHAWGLLAGWLPPRALGTLLTMAALITGAVGLIQSLMNS